MEDVIFFPHLLNRVIARFKSFQIRGKNLLAGEQRTTQSNYISHHEDVPKHCQNFRSCLSLPGYELERWRHKSD